MSRSFNFRLSLLAFSIGFAFFLASCRDVDTIREALETHTIPNAKYVGMETCAACHEDQVKHFRFGFPLWDEFGKRRKDCGRSL